MELVANDHGGTPESDLSPNSGKRFVFQHGWGFSSSCWDGWINFVPSPVHLGNRGYWGTKILYDTADIQPGFILVCHSLGIHLVPQALICQAKLVVVIGGFAHFHGETAADGRFTRRHVQRMLSRLKIEPEQLIRDFHRDCDYPESPSGSKTINTSLLAQDLQILNESRLTRSSCQQWPPTLIIHGQNDRIVIPQRGVELAALTKTGRVKIIDGAGHGLPFSHPRLCLNLILDFLQHIAHSGK